jgi:hypothetical protein
LGWSATASTIRCKDAASKDFKEKFSAFAKGFSEGFIAPFLEPLLVGDFRGGDGFFLGFDKGLKTRFFFDTIPPHPGLRHNFPPYLTWFHG